MDAPFQTIAPTEGFTHINPFSHRRTAYETLFGARTDKVKVEEKEKPRGRPEECEEEKNYCHERIIKLRNT